MTAPVSRRKFLATAGAAACVVPLLAFSSKDALAAPVDPNGAQAKGLQYTHESQVAGKNCANCQLYTGGSAEWGPCAIFPGQEVAAKGWCTAWVAKA